MFVRSIVLAAFAGSLALACGKTPSASQPNQQQPESVEITSADQLEHAVGELVTLRGVVSDTKVPTILSVEVSCDDPDLRGQPARATGVLHRRVVTQQEIDDRVAAQGQFAHSGPGTFYFLARPDGGLAAAMPVRSLPTQGVQAADDYETVICRIAQDIEAIKGQYPQLADFSSTDHCDPKGLVVTYAFHTHRPQHRAGWAGGVPNPNPDGVWFYIDFHDPDSAAQIHTQPAGPRRRFRDKKVMFLILEGERTKTLAGALSEILSRNGVGGPPVE